MKIITFDGRLGKDAEIKEGRSGKKFLSFTVANNSFYEGQQRVDWFDVVCFDPFVIDRFTDESGNIRMLRKGAYVIITGTVNSVVNAGNNGNMYINHKVNATIIDKPNIGSTGESRTHEANTDAEPTLSVYTAITQTQATAPQQEAPKAPKTVANLAYLGNFESNDDLPF